MSEFSPPDNGVTHLYYFYPKLLAISDQIGLLNNEEIVRSQSFRFEKDRHIYVVTRGILKSILGQFLQIEPKQIRLNFTKYGKPYLSQNRLFFNVSHSKEVSLIGINTTTPIGVDVEYINNFKEIERVAQRFFSPAEFRELSELNDRIQFLEGFYNCWTRKESFIKAIGEGLSFPLDQFRVSLLPGEEAKLLETYYNPADRKRWSIYSFKNDDYIGACFVEAETQQFRLINYQ